MSRCCCCRNSWNDGDLEIERHYKRDVERRRGQEQGVLQDAAALTAMKRQVVDEAAFKGSGGGGAAAAHAGSVARSSAASSAAAAAAAGSGDEHGDGLIPAVPGARREDAPSAPGLGYGLAEPDRRALQAETAAQEVYFSAVDEAVDTLRTLGLVRAAAAGRGMDASPGAAAASPAGRCPPPAKSLAPRRRLQWPPCPSPSPSAAAAAAAVCRRWVRRWMSRM